MKLYNNSYIKKVVLISCIKLIVVTNLLVAQKVGIGSTQFTPSNTLDVKGNMSIGTNYTGIATTAPSNGLLVEGNVGIGTSAPTEKLEVAGSINLNSGANTTNYIKTPITQSLTFQFGTENWPGYGTRTIKFSVTGGGYAQVDYGGAGTYQYTSYSNIFHMGYSGINFTNGGGFNGAQPFQINSNPGTNIMGGNVGIGTTSPLSKLEITGDVAVNSGSAATRTYGSNFGLAAGYNSPTAGRLLFGDNTGWKFHFARGTAALATDLVTIQDNGNVGIGTTTPLSKLHLSSGAANTTAIETIENTAGNFQTFITTANPNSVITGSIGDIANDVSNGIVYYKASGNSSNTGWIGLNSAIPFTIKGSSYTQGNQAMLKIGSTTHYSTHNRGLRFTIINKSDYSALSSTVYDTYASTTDANSLATALDALTRDQIGILTSQDAWEMSVTSNLRNSFTRLGLYRALMMQSTRTPYCAIFEGATGASKKSNKAVEVSLTRDDLDVPVAEIRGFFIDNNFVASGSTPNALTNATGTTIAAIADESGNVGIGTTSMGAKLQIDKLAVGDLPLRINSPVAVDNVFWDFRIGTVVASTHPKSLTISGSSAASDFVVSPSTSALGAFIVKGNGNVGVGTATPSQKFSIAGDLGFPSNTAITTPGYPVFANVSGYGLQLSTLNFGVGTNNSATPNFTINSAGRVGIGTTGPQGTLDVYNASVYNGNVNDDAVNSIVLSAGNGGAGNYNGGITWEILGSNRKRAGIASVSEQLDADFVGLSFWTNNTDGPFPMAERVRISSTGNMGIGTTVPSAQLHTTGTVRFANYASGILSVDASGNLSVGTTGNYVWQTTGNAGTVAGTNFIGTTDAIDLVFKTNNTERMRVLANGNIGIGKIAPAKSLHVLSTWDNHVLLERDFTGTPGYGNLTIGGTAADPDLRFSAGLTTAQASQIVLKSTGNVGIGITAPTQKLDVVGSIKTRNSTGNASGFSIISGAPNPSMGIHASDDSQRFTIGSTLSAFTTEDLLAFSATAASNVLVLQGNGNTAIGTNVPLAKLDVRGRGLFWNGQGGGSTPTAAQTRNAAEFLLAASSMVTIGENTLGDANPAVTLYRTTGGSRTGTATRIYQPSSFGQLYFQQGSNDVAYGTETFSTRLAIDIAGNVGVGTTSATERLEVAGNIKVTGTGTQTLDKLTIARVGSDIQLNTTSGAWLRFGAAGSRVISDSPFQSSELNSSISDITFSAGIDEATALRGFVFKSKTTEIMRLQNDGNLGIGANAPTEKLEVCGNIKTIGNINASGTINASQAITCSSDIRFKENITPIKNALQNITQLNGVNYTFKTTEFPDQKFSDKPQIGFIAQQLEKTFPEFVFTDKEGYKSVDYARLTPVLVEAIKELNAKNLELSEKNKSYEVTLNELLQKINATNIMVEKLKQTITGNVLTTSEK